MTDHPSLPEISGFSKISKVLGKPGLAGHHVLENPRGMDLDQTEILILKKTKYTIHHGLDSSLMTYILSSQLWFYIFLRNVSNITHACVEMSV